MNSFDLFDFEYEFDDQEQAKKLEEAVVEYFYFYEIGHDVPDYFKKKFVARWKRIISYYNQLHNTTLLQYNPLTNYSMEEALDELNTTDNTQTSSTTATGSSTGNTDATSEGTGKTSDYPQQPIAGGDYLAGATDSTTTTNTTDNTTSDSTADGTTTESGTDNRNYTKTIEGITGISYQELIQKERANIVTMTSNIINEMKPCFILVY